MIPCSASARAVPGPDRGDPDAGERPSVATRRSEPVEQQPHAVRARQADEVIGAELGRSTRERDDPDRGRLDDGRAERAEPGREPARLGPCPGDGDPPAGERRTAKPLESRAERGHRPEHGDRRRLDPGVPADVGDRLQRRGDRALVGQRPALHERSGLGGGAPARDETLGDRGELTDAHVDDERPGKAGKRRPVKRRLRFRRVLVTGDERDRARGVAVGHGDPGVGRRRDAGRDPGHDLEVDVRRAQRLGLLAAAAEHERIAALEPDD